MRTKSKVVRQKPPADFEEVKRRFIRQNRELAKNNSNQSLRIRSLELEVSRLLADNLELRNQVLQLQNEVYTAQSKASNAAVRKGKEELQAKIAELSGLVEGIEEAQDDAADRWDATKGKRPIEGNWRERQPLTELMRDSQMPTIVEDKLYPRRTLGADEIQAIRLSDQSSNESPDLGPPPVAHFDYEDPVKNASPLVSKTSPPQPGTVNEEDELPAGLSVNLETRRKRKDGQSRLEIRRRSLLPQEPTKAEGESSSILRTGAKRKLADRESEKPIKPPSKGDFTFRQKAAADDARAAEKTKPVTGEAEETRPASPKPIRKVLGEKSTNLSPRKAPSRLEKPEKDTNAKPKADTSTNGKETGPTRRRRVSAIPVPSPPHESVVNTVEISPPESAVTADAELKTPAALDLFSPTPSEPSAKPEGRGDTPPPSDLSSLSATTDGGTRPSRRARPAVSYAEPSLISKMRRPDKKMVDAISGLQDPRRAMSGSTERKLSSGVVSIKQEPVDDESWKDLPPATNIEVSSPLHLKGSSDGPEPIPTEHAAISNELSAGDKPSASSATISALMAGSRKRRQSSQQPLGTDIEAATRKLEELDIYEFKESSSPMTDSSGGGRTERPGTSKSHRRHSSVPKDIKVTADAVGADSRVNAVAGRSERVASRRRSMML